MLVKCSCIEGVDQRFHVYAVSGQNVSAANFPPIIAWKASATSGSFSFTYKSYINRYCEGIEMQMYLEKSGYSWKEIEKATQS